MIIPIQNFYYLLSYAWDKTEISSDSQMAGSENGDNISNLLARMLLPEVRKLVNLGLATEYLPQTSRIKGIKGKLLLSETFGLNKKAMVGQTICSVEELSPDILPNQIIKTTLIQLQQTEELALNFKKEVGALLAMFTIVRVIAPGSTMPEKMALPRYQSERYRFILNCCNFIRQNLLPTTEGTDFTFKSLLTDKKQMALIFEAFVRNFYRREQTLFQVKSEKIDWQGKGLTEEAQRFLPVMFTDISLNSPLRKIIIDTKFYKKALLQHYDKEKLHSKHLYQLFTYLHNTILDNIDQTLEGMLLYPVVVQPLNLEYILNGKKVRVFTINLNQPWAGIKEDLLRLLL